jgi:hypothetical protein
VVGRAIIVCALVRRSRAAADLASLAAAVRPAKTVRHSDRSAVGMRAERATAVGPAHTLGLGAVRALSHLALNAASVAPALARVLGAAHAVFDNAELATLFHRRDAGLIGCRLDKEAARPGRGLQWKPLPLGDWRHRSHVWLSARYSRSERWSAQDERERVLVDPHGCTVLLGASRRCWCGVEY